jgi:hypothetical protein
MMQLRNGKTVSETATFTPTVSVSNPVQGMTLRNGFVKPVDVPADTYFSPWTQHRDWLTSSHPLSPYRSSHAETSN